MCAFAPKSSSSSNVLGCLRETDPKCRQAARWSALPVTLKARCRAEGARDRRFLQQENADPARGKKGKKSSALVAAYVSNIKHCLFISAAYAGHM